MGNTGNTNFHGNLFIQSASDVMTTGTLDFTSKSIYTRGGISLEGTLVCGKSIIINRSVELAANSAANYTLTLPDTLPTKNSMLICDDNGKLSFVQLCQTQSPDTLSNPKINTQNASLSQRLSIVEQQIYDISEY